MFYNFQNKIYCNTNHRKGLSRAKKKKTEKIPQSDVVYLYFLRRQLKLVTLSISCGDNLQILLLCNSVHVDNDVNSMLCYIDFKSENA